MYKIYAVCASGIGTSLFARKLISDSISELGYDTSDFVIKCIGAQESKTQTDVDAFVTGETLARGIPNKEGVEKIIVVNMINDKPGMKTALGPALEKAVLDGKIKPAAK